MSSGSWPESTVLQLPQFTADARELIGADNIEKVAVYPIDYSGAADVIPGSRGVHKWPSVATRTGKRGGARIIYLYVVVASRIYLIRCYAKTSRLI